jgi:protocatechuate 3,4-dioxygenase beta subunit
MAESATIERPETTELPMTPPQILGPFYPFMHQPIETGDLTGGGRATGTVLYLSGRVVNKSGVPVAGARVEIWQANAHGRYAHPNDDSTQPLDENFNGFAVVNTDADGRYAFRTVRPAAYQVSPGRWRPAHIHFSVTGKTEQLVTQMYFKGEKWNETDSWLNSAARKDALIVDPQPKSDEPSSLQVAFDIVLMRG